MVIMSKLEVGMFVRTKEGLIFKIEKYLNRENNIQLFYKECKVKTIKNIDEIKTSHNIIDLIEVGDLIEHEKIGIKQIKDKDKYNQYIWYSKNHNPSTCDIEDAITFEAFESEFEVGNISIVTKEMMESVSYKVM